MHNFEQVHPDSYESVRVQFPLPSNSAGDGYYRTGAPPLDACVCAPVWGAA